MYPGSRYKMQVKYAGSRYKIQVLDTGSRYKMLGIDTQSRYFWTHMYYFFMDLDTIYRI